jgi:hypothetical protein
MLTPMTEEFHTKTMVFEATREKFKEIREKNNWVDTDESAKKMLYIVKEDKFTSGEQIDFYDC